MDRHCLQATTGERIPPKTIFLVRHGQSLHNAHSLQEEGADLNDIRYVDSRLTAAGHQQAFALAEEIARVKPELIVTSPMTRATETCLDACRLIPRVPIVVHQLCRERLAYSCDIGTPASVLKERFPNLDYSSIEPDCWWWSKPGTIPSVENSVNELRKHPPGAYVDVEPVDSLHKRINDFRRWLLLLPESRIIVFSHGVFLKSFVGDNKRFANGEMRKIVI
ncbi:phosphoglycerate mutase [Gracilaria domingensis]|nr:phosphoglycerate mutase [Gracilaria domingensis]